MKARKKNIPKEHLDRMSAIGRLAREYRLNSGKTQRENAELAKVSRSWLQNFEKNGNSSLRFLLKYSDALDIGLDDLFWLEK
jgi:transcriptional regulator with XRE-family HTH domain